MAFSNPSMPSYSQPARPATKTNMSAGKRVKISKEKEEEVITRFNSDFLEAVGGCRQVHERAAKAHKHYTSFINKDPRSPYFTDSYDAQFFGSTTAAVSNEFGIIMAAPYFLRFQDRSPQGKMLADFYNAAFDFHWNEDPRRNRKLQNILLQRRLYGTAYVKVFWNEEWRHEGFMRPVQEVENVVVANPFDGLPSVVQQPVTTHKWVTERRKKKDSPWFQPLNFFSCFPDTKQEDVQDGRFFITRCRRTKEYVKEQGRKGQWYKQCVKELLDAGGTGTAFGNSVEYIETLNSQVGFSENEWTESAHDGIYEEFEYWTPEFYACIVNNRVVCYRRGHLLGYYPIFQVRNYYVPGEHFGMSDYQVIEKSLADFQNMHNTMLCNAYLNAFPPTVVGYNVELKEFRQAYRPGGILRIPGMQDVNSGFRQLPASTDAIDMARVMKESLRGGMDNTLATSDTARGALPTRMQSATAVAQASQSLSMRQGMQAAMLETELIQPLGEAFRDMISKLQSEPITVKLRGGKEWVSLQPIIDTYDPDLDCVPVSSTSRLNELEQKRLMEAMNIAANFRIPNVNLQEGFKVFVESLAPKLAERLIMSNDEYQAMMQQQAMMQRLLEPPQADNGGPGPMAASNQIGTTPEDQAMNEGAQDMGTEQQL